MGSNGTHKNKKYLSKEKNQKCIYKSLFMVVNRSALVPRTQRKKLELNPSYGYRAMSNNVRKCTKCARHFDALPLEPI